MDERNLLLAAIHDSPDEDTPRLVFADFLDEHDEHDHAEFIRAQIALNRMGVCDPSRARLDRRARELLAAHGGDWQDARGGGRVFQRGFPDRMNLEENAMGDAGVARLLESTHLADLHELNLESNELSDRTARLFARSSDLRHLTYLSLYGNAITDAGMLELVLSPHLSRLTKLDLRHNQVSDAGVLDLVRCPGLARLKVLGLWNNRMNTGSLKKLKKALPNCSILI